MSTTLSPRARRTGKSAGSTAKKSAKRPEPARRVPAFRNRQEEAEFWDTHSFADYWDDFTPTNVRFAKKLSEPVTMRLDTTTLGELRVRARAKGIGPTTLIRIWILERLQAEHRAERRRKAKQAG
jgi:hypothetical protein